MEANLLESSSFLEVGAKVAGILGAFIGIAIAWCVYRLDQGQREDSWLRAFNELHQQFWKDRDFATVRAWLANDSAYQELEPTLEERLIARKLTEKIDYGKLEKLDKFFNFLLRTRNVIEQLPKHQDMWKRLYFQFWLDQIVDAGRHHLWIYFKKFYIEHDADLPLRKDKIFTEECRQLEEQLKRQRV